MSINFGEASPIPISALTSFQDSWEGFFVVLVPNPCSVCGSTFYLSVVS